MGLRTTTPVEYDNNLNYSISTDKDNSDNPKDSKPKKTIRPMSLALHRKNNADVMTKQFLSKE